LVKREAIVAMKKSAQVLGVVALVALAILKVQADGANEVIRLDPALDDILAADAKVEKVASGFGRLEGPVWVREGKGYLIFSDMPADAMYKWSPDGGITQFLRPSGYTSAGTPDVSVPLNFGSNGITLDRQGRVIFCTHGDRNVARLEKDGRRTVVADRYEGKRFNGPNDLVVKSDGAVYFTDPGEGLRKGKDDPAREIPFDGVYLVKDGKVQLVDKGLRGYNGLTFSRDEKYFYVNAELHIWRYEVQPDDTIANRQNFIDMSEDVNQNRPGSIAWTGWNNDPTYGVPDGMKIDQKGNLYGAGPLGVWIVSPQGKHIGTVKTPEFVTNIAFGDADGKTLYITASRGLYRIRLKTPGILP
jgi:gluconolactonase